MNWRRAERFLLASMLVCGAWGCDRNAGVDGTDATAHDPHAGGGSFTVLEDGIELFVEYPHQIQGVESEEAWAVHLTWFDGWQPVADATMRVEMHSPDGADVEFSAQPDLPGVYLVVPTLPASGDWHVDFLVEVGDRNYAFEAGYLEVFATEDEAGAHSGHDHAQDGTDPHAGHTHAENEADAHAGHDHAEDEADAHAGHDHAEDEADAHAGHDHAEDDPDAHADEEDLPADDEAAPEPAPATGLITLAKQEQWSFPFAVALAEEREIAATIPVAGELVAPPGGLVHATSPVAGLVRVDGPSIGPGDRVRSGETLALIAPVGLDDSYVRTRADVAAAQVEADRAERLYDAGAIPRRRLEDAQRELQVAVAAFEAIGGTSRGAGEGDVDSDLYHLRSPIDGVVAARDVALGQQVDIGERAFTIVNTTTIWLVARVPARHAPQTNRIRGAWFTVEGSEGAWTASRVLSVGSIIDPSSRTLPVRFAVNNAGGALKVGMLAQGHVQLGEPIPGVAVPAPAIQDENGLPVIYVKRTGDTFERRVVETGASDGFWTMVASGLAIGEQVVTVGAYQVNLAALGVVEPAHDHAH